MPGEVRLLIVKLSAIGDCLLATPALSALRDALGPEARIDWVVHPHCAPVVAGNPRLHTVHRLTRQGWWRQLGALRREFRAIAYTTVLDQQGLLKSALVARMAGAREVVGPAHPREPLARRFYTRTVFDDPAAHVVAVYLNRAAAVGARWATEPAMELPVFLEDLAHAQRLLQGLQGPIIALNPGAGRPDKQWPPAAFAALADRLLAEGRDVVITGGPGDRALAGEVRAAAPNSERVRDLTGQTSLNQLGALFRSCAAFVGGDTGPMHMAQASGCPTIALFGPTDPAILGPRLPMHRTVDAWALAQGRPAGSTRPRLEGGAALAALKASTVAEVILHLPGPD